MTLEYLELMEAMNDEKSVPRKVRGTLTIKGEDDMEFRADRKTGLSSQEEIAKTAAGKLYRTVGEKKQTMVAHITVPDTERDPRAFLYEQVERLSKSLPQGRKPPQLKGRRLLDDADAQVTLAAKEHKVTIALTIDVAQTPNYNYQLMNLMQRVSQCFAINQTSLNQLRK